jgi:hypothetical protein
MKKLALVMTVLGGILGIASAQTYEYYDQFGHPIGSFEQNPGGGTYYDQFGHPTGSVEYPPQYDENHHPILPQ